MNSKAALTVKLALASLVLAAGAAQAQTVNQPSSGNGDLMLYVYDVTNGNTYAEDLGVGTNSILTAAAIQGAGATAGTVSTALTFANQTFAADATLSAYLLANSTHQFQWGLMAGTVTATGNTGNPIGSEYFLSTANVSVPSTYTTATAPINNNLNASWVGLSGAMGSLTPSLTLNGVNANSSSTTFSATSGSPWGTSLNTQKNWFNIGHIDTRVGSLTVGGATGLGTASNLYGIVNNESGTSGLALIFNLGTASLSSSGVLSLTGTGAVPLPAAVWLFGSGLLGLAGIGRRKQVAAV